MPGLPAHQALGGPTGALAALASARDQPPALALIEGLGGYWAGQYAAMWPDLAEPATSSHHRGVFHAAVPSAYGAMVAIQNAHQLQAQLRIAARECFLAARLTPNDLQQLLHHVMGLLLHFAAGAVPAVPAAYMSHVLADAGTPRGVPLLVRGF